MPLMDWNIQLETLEHLALLLRFVSIIRTSRVWLLQNKHYSPLLMLIEVIHLEFDLEKELKLVICDCW